MCFAGRLLSTHNHSLLISKNKCFKSEVNTRKVSHLIITLNYQDELKISITRNPGCKPLSNNSVRLLLPQVAVTLICCSFVIN